MPTLVMPLETLEAEAAPRDWQAHSFPIFTTALAVVAAMIICLSPATEPALMIVAGP